MITFPDIEEGKGSVLMLNMLRYRDRRLYFEAYVPAFEKVVKQLGIEGTKVTLLSEVVANIVADKDEVWDAIVLVEYPSAEAFKTIVISDAYRDLAEPLRIAALDDLKLFMTRKTEF